MIATYIQELLATNNRVIVPNFGAFLVRATSKSKDANTLKEKLKDIYFSPFLKFNDELLEKYIIKKENITKEQAAQKITEFIDRVKKELDNEKPFVIADFGEFVADKQGKVQFTPAIIEETKTSKEDKKAEEKPIARKTTKKSTEEKETKPVAKEEPKAEEKTSITEVKKESKKEIVLEEFKDEEPAHQAGGKTPETVVKEETKSTIIVEPGKSIYSYKKEKKSMNKGLIWSIAIGLPVAAIFIWALLNFSTVKKVFNKEKAKTEKVSQKKKTTTAKKTTAKAKPETAPTTKEEAKKPVAKEVQKPVPPQKKYYIIAGSFKNEKYAISYMNKLKAEGYNAEKLAERNGMHAVSFNSFTEKNKAIAEYKFLAQEKGLQAWILYY
ncbi:MAG TPA: hypothetical protein DCG75_15905 [Bacteroidales bacterium]|jgi:nucleoid DNA-binding protein|nr:hypothetical protein [Bacteroidales bacterium]